VRTALPGGDPVCALNGWESCSGSTTSCPRMVHLTESALREVGKSLKGSTIALLSRAFINDSDDARKTPAEPFFEMAAAGAEVRVHDPGWIQQRRRTPRRGSRGI
jgi:UDP-N-acetyl-D-mannosaminuronate dehydrogenase